MSFLSSLAGALCLIPLLLVLLMVLSSAFSSRTAALELPPLRVTVARVEPAALAALEPGGGGVAQALRATGALIAPVTLQVSSPDDPLQALEDALGDLRLQPLCEPDQGGEAVVAIRLPDLTRLLELLPIEPGSLRADALALLGPLREAAAAAQREGHDLLVLAAA